MKWYMKLRKYDPTYSMKFWGLITLIILGSWIGMYHMAEQTYDPTIERTTLLRGTNDEPGLVASVYSFSSYGNILTFDGDIYYILIDKYVGQKIYVLFEEEHDCLVDAVYMMQIADIARYINEESGKNIRSTIRINYTLGDGQFIMEVPDNVTSGYHWRLVFFNIHMARYGSNVKYNVYNPTAYVDVRFTVVDGEESSG